MHHLGDKPAAVRDLDGDGVENPRAAGQAITGLKAVLTQNRSLPVIRGACPAGLGALDIHPTLSAPAAAPAVRAQQDAGRRQGLHEVGPFFGRDVPAADPDPNPLLIH